MSYYNINKLSYSHTVLIRITYRTEKIYLCEEEQRKEELIDTKLSLEHFLNKFKCWESHRTSYNNSQRSCLFLYFYICKLFFCYICRIGLSNISKVHYTDKNNKNWYRWAVQCTLCTYSIYLYIMPILVNLRQSGFFATYVYYNCFMTYLFKTKIFSFFPFKN